MTVHQKWLESLNAYRNQLEALGLKVQLPPPTLNELQLEYVEVEAGKLMRAKLPFQKRYTNPIGLYQGGILAAAVDEVFGPLSYLTAGRPCVTLSMNLTFLKPFQEKMGHCEITAMILRQTKTLIFMRAEVKDPTGELLAHAESHVSIMRDEQLMKASP